MYGRMDCAYVYVCPCRWRHQANSVLYIAVMLMADGRWQMADRGCTVPACRTAGDVKRWPLAAVESGGVHCCGGGGAAAAAAGCDDRPGRLRTGAEC